MEIVPYLTFQGECQEAIDLYTKAFNSEIIEIMRFKDLTQNPNHPVKIDEHQKNWVVQCTLKIGDNFIRVSDSIKKPTKIEGERISIAVECTPAEARKIFSKLSKEGTIGALLQKTFFSPCYGLVTDKFGVNWVIIGQK